VVRYATPLLSFDGSIVRYETSGLRRVSSTVPASWGEIDGARDSTSPANYRHLESKRRGRRAAARHRASRTGSRKPRAADRGPGTRPTGGARAASRSASASGTPVPIPAPVPLPLGRRAAARAGAITGRRGRRTSR
jgi:hypothetical protein